jgi:putative transcriptional regulator
VHFGGPVEPRRGFVLHSTDWAGQDTIEVAGRWALSGTIDILKAIAEGQGPGRWLVALGYAGWGAGQLDGEMLRHGWFNIAGDERLLFDTEADDRWTEGFERAGIDPRLLASQTGTA